VASASCDFAQDDTLRSAQNDRSFFVAFVFFVVKRFFFAPSREMFAGETPALLLAPKLKAGAQGAGFRITSSRAYTHH
jgi:hypothetical protein